MTGQTVQREFVALNTALAPKHDGSSNCIAALGRQGLWAELPMVLQ